MISIRYRNNLPGMYIKADPIPPTIPYVKIKIIRLVENAAEVKPRVDTKPPKITYTVISTRVPYMTVIYLIDEIKAKIIPSIQTLRQLPNLFTR